MEGAYCSGASGWFEFVARRRVPFSACEKQSLETMVQAEDDLCILQSLANVRLVPDLCNSHEHYAPDHKLSPLNPKPQAGRPPKPLTPQAPDPQLGRTLNPIEPFKNPYLKDHGT